MWWYSPSLSGLTLMLRLTSMRYEFQSILFDVCSPSIGCIPRQPPLAQPQSETSSYPNCGRSASIHQTGASSTSDRPSGSSPPYITFLPHRWHTRGHHSYDFHNPQDIHFYSPARCPIGGSGFSGVDDGLYLTDDWLKDKFNMQPNRFLFASRCMVAQEAPCQLSRH